MDGQRKALIVANDEYEHEGLRHLLAPAADAAALAGVLGDAQIGDFDVNVVRNESAHVIQAQIEDIFSESRPDDVLLLHFSCHGLKNESGELFFAARNTRPNRLGSTAIPADFVQRCMRASRSRSIVLLLDCCYGGAFSQGVTVRASGDVHVLDSFPGGKLGGGRGRAVITASSAMEYAFEGDQLADDHSQRPSVFTSALVEGLATGEADRDEDGWVSLNELYDYVFDRVREQNPHQTPSRDVEMQGELYLARSRRRRIRGLPIPPELEAARTASDMYTRLGAVGELRSRLASENLPAAAGAYEALAATAGTDIRYVADAAAEAMREAAVRTVERELHFGQVAKDSSLAHRTVRLLGPPLARACTFQASGSWIRVGETAEGLDVSVDTSRAGTLRGDITIKGLTGEAVIAVDVEVTPGLDQPPSPSARPIGAAQPTTAPTPTSATTRTQPPEPATERPPGSGPNPPAQSPHPPAPVPQETASAATPTRSVPSAGRRLWSDPMRAAILAGPVTILLGVLFLTLASLPGKGVVIGLQLVVYGVFRIIEGKAASRRRTPLMVLGVGSLVVAAAVLVLSAVPVSYVETIRPIIGLFWVVGGVVEVVGAIRGSRPARGLEIVSGVLGVAVGFLLGLYDDYGEGGLLFRTQVIVLGIWLVILGIIILIVGFKQRNVLHGPAASGRGSDGADSDPPRS